MYKLFQQSSAETDHSRERTVLINVLNSITDGVCLLDNDWNICFWNKAAERILRQPADNVLNRNIWDVFPDAKELELYSKYTNAKEKNEPVEFEEYYEPLNIWGEVRAFPTEDGFAIYFKDITAKKLQSQHILNQRNIHQATINSTPELIWTVDKDFRLLAANKTFRDNTKKYSGFQVQEGDMILMLMGKEEGDRWRPLYERALTGEAFKHDQVINFPDGTINYVEISLNPIIDDDAATVTGVACYARDISASKRYISLIENKNQKLQEKEQELRSLTGKLESILNNSVDIIASTDKNGFYASMNKASQHLLGYDPEEIIGKHFTDWVHPEDIEITKASAEQIRKGLKTTAFRNRIVKKNGEVVHMIWSARWDEKTEMVFSVGRDATALYEAEKLVLESEQRFAAVISKGADMISILDVNGVYKFVSNNALQILGYNATDLLGKRAFDLIHEDDREQISKEFEKAFDTKEVYIRDFRFKDAAGKWRWLEVICTNMLENKAIEGLIINSRDITERKLQEEKLKEAISSLYKQNSALKEIAFIQSHEVRRPLANILGLTEILTQDKLINEQKATLKMLKKSALELDNMIRKIVSTTYEYTTSLQTGDVESTMSPLKK